MIPNIGFSAEQARASIATGFATNYAGTLTPEMRQMVDAFAAALSETIEKNNQRVAADLSQQVARFMGGAFGRLR